MLGLDRVVLSTPDQSSPTSSILSSLHSYQTSRDIRSESRATRTPCHPIAPTSSSRRLRERESPILFQLSPSKCNHFPAEQCTPVLSLLGQINGSVRHHVTESSQRRWKEFRFCALAWSIVAADCCGREYCDLGWPEGCGVA
jgi:hypothetical protein